MTAAQCLIGCRIVTQTEEGLVRVRITETEAYKGAKDPASHAFRGMTPRNKLMFGDTGVLYVYFIYGMHFCANIVAHAPGEVGAVLLRAGVPEEGIVLIRERRPGVPDRSLLNGPGKLAKGLGIDMSYNGSLLLQTPRQRIWLEPRDPDAPLPVLSSSPRIGISKGRELLWRFVTTG